MTEFEQQLLVRIESLEKTVKRLTSAKKTGLLSPEEITYFENLPRKATVGKDYVAFRFGCTIRAVARNEAGTHLCKRVSLNPMKFTKSQVDEAWAEYSRSNEAVAAIARKNAGKRSRTKI